MGIQIILIAAVFVTLSNLFMRKSIDAGGSSRAFLMIQLFLAFLVAILLNPVRTAEYAWSGPIAIFGFAGGIFLGAMMAFLGKALEVGPPGLTFAILNSSTVMPAIVMALFFGSKFGYAYNVFHGFGSLFVLVGLFWAGWGVLKVRLMALQGQGALTGVSFGTPSGFKIENKKKWLLFALGAFVFHVAFLVFMQWRSLFLNAGNIEGLLFSFSPKEAANQWFMPMIFLATALVQFWIFCRRDRRLPNRKEVQYGILGGIAHGVGTYFLIWATEVATPLEQAMIFPIFAVAIIIFCNGWGQWLYKEKVNWKANVLCTGGLLVGTIDWQRIFA